MLRASELSTREYSEHQCSLIYNVQCGILWSECLSALQILQFRQPLKWPTTLSSALTTELGSLLTHTQGLARKLQAGEFDQGWN